MRLYEVQELKDDSLISDEEVVPEGQNDDDTDQSFSDNESSSDSGIANCSLNSWVNEQDQPDHNSDSEFDTTSDDDILDDRDNDITDDDSDETSDDSDDSDDDMLDDSEEGDDLQNSQDDSSDDEIPDVLQDGGDINDNDLDSRDETEEYDEEEEDKVLAPSISASTERNRNHLPNLCVSSALIGGFSYQPKINVLALGFSNGDIFMYKNLNAKNEHLRTNDNVYLKKVMIMEFNETGDYIYSACKDNNISETEMMKEYFGNAHRNGSFLTPFSIIDDNTFARGDEESVVHVWNICANGCRFSFKKNGNSIDSMITINNSSYQPNLACTSGDGTLTIIDLSTKKMVIQSKPYKSVLTNCVTMKRKSILVCSTNEGSLITFSTRDYNMFNDEFLLIYANSQQISSSYKNHYNKCFK